MSNFQFFTYLLVLAGSTYLIRVIPFIALKEKINNRFVRSFLAYIPYAVLTAMLNYIQNNNQDVTLESLSEQFHLSEPYVSKYIKDKSGKTFGEHVAHIRMKRAKTLLKNGNMTVENIAYAVGYQNVEHFNRTFKKSFDMTPIQYRNEARSN